MCTCFDFVDDYTSRKELWIPHRLIWSQTDGGSSPDFLKRAPFHFVGGCLISSILPPFREDTYIHPPKNDFTNTLYLFYKHKNSSKQTTSRNDSILTCYLVIENRINTLRCCFPYFLLVYISIGTPSHPHIPWHTYNSFSRLNWASHFCCTTTAIVKGTQCT